VAQLHALARHDLRAICHGVDLEAEACLDDPIELRPLVAHDGILGQPGEPAADREQRGHGRGRVLGIEGRDRLVARARDLGAARHAVPGRVHAVEEIGRRRVAGEQHERLDPRALVHGRGADAEALRPVHATAPGRDRRERLARDRIPAPDLDLHHAWPIRHVRGQAGDGHAAARIRRPGALADVVDDAARLPGPELTELLGKRRGVGGEPERFDGENGRRGVVPVRGRGLRGEPRDDHVRAELTDHAHDVAEDGRPVPDVQRLLGALRVPEVLRAREVLPPAVQPARGEQLLRARHAERLAELGAEQVLSAVAAGEREIGRPVSAAARQIGDDLRVLVVRVGGNVEDAAHRREAAQLLQDRGPHRGLGGEADVGGAHQDGHAEGGPERHVPEGLAQHEGRRHRRLTG
jgi:hypothetical protein